MPHEVADASVRDVPQTATDFIEANKGRRALLEHEVKGLLKEMGLSVPRGIFIRKSASPRQAESPAHDLRYPLVAKVSSEVIPSKSDVHGIRTGISDEKVLLLAVNELMRIDKAEGVLVEEMAPQGVEVIVGAIRDPQFGPVVMFGLGGIFVELFKDVSFGLAPMSEKEAMRLVREVKGYKLLEGYRGRPPMDIKSLLNVIVAVSKLSAIEAIEEMDLNPVAVYPEGSVVLDAKISLRPL